MGFGKQGQIGGMSAASPLAHGRTAPSSLACAGAPEKSGGGRSPAVSAPAEKPDFSPAMLRLFLHARCRHAHGPGRRGYQAVAKRERDRLRRAAGVTAAQMEFAWMGRLNSAEARARIWAALGFDCSLVLAAIEGARPAGEASPPGDDSVGAHGRTAPSALACAGAPEKSGDGRSPLPPLAGGSGAAEASTEARRPSGAPPEPQAARAADARREAGYSQASEATGEGHNNG